MTDHIVLAIVGSGFGHADDVGSFSLNFDRSSSEFGATEVEGHIYICFFIEGEIGASFGLFCEGIFENGHSGDSATIFEDQL